ncbi:glycosyltransferase [Mucilaginibacter pallidiroseus]|uniref:Glycosyltransferase n=1 Tax=Mucilaginibacter pallidiroseus TaxID=2599295 RepID=A0A563U0N7_9SPHI|nr:glycosyltransferase [Mucilaginibacter pallidiroseus]TWR25194.1 glycosyltransferase [Mucilaginibacter pallidiroseus]
MPRCRVYLFTYKRNNLLPRALKSLLDQTFTDWICEVHNDHPEDTFPERYIAQLNDSRLIIKNHLQNLGGIKSFNLAFKNCAEEFASILEDDNWWEPTFLEEMLSILVENPVAKIAWSNMRIWREDDGDRWTDSGETTWRLSANKLFSWPQPNQVLAALHSNGAMVYRTINCQKYAVPDNALLNAVELIRERSFEHPLLFHAKPLANFSITKTTNRTNIPYHWIAVQCLMLASFVKSDKLPGRAFKIALSNHRDKKPSPVTVFFLANLLILKSSSFYKYFNINDWFQITKWLIKHASHIPDMKRYLHSQMPTYKFLLKHTRERFLEIQQPHN